MKLPQLSVRRITFSIRELFAATLIVALTLGWWLDRHQLRATIEETQGKLTKAAKWRTRAGALEDKLRDDGYCVEWVLKDNVVGIRWPSKEGMRHRGPHGTARDLDAYNPSVAESARR